MQENSMLLDSCAKCFHIVRFCCFSCKLLSRRLTHLSFTILMTSHETDLIQQNEKKRCEKMFDYGFFLYLCSKLIK